MTKKTKNPQHSR